ncbi:MAG: ABC transporter substrate-binding protein [Deltaproteobacteria bacterium]|jgi:iron complex transport system substrate-binding protein|nr:ABC transporter substrate-binding protein [Deltaproteobacteria bacterium]
MTRSGRIGNFLERDRQEKQGGSDKPEALGGLANNIFAKEAENSKDRSNWPVYFFLIVFLFLSFLCIHYQKTRNFPTQSSKLISWTTDLAGRRVALPGIIDSVATLGSTPILNSLLEILGQGHKICNQPTLVHDISGRWRMHKIFAPQLTEAPFLRDRNNELILENLLLVSPSLSITMTPSYLDSLERLNLPVVWVDWATTEKMLETVGFLGEVFNQKTRATEFISYFHSRLELARAITADIPPSEKKTIVYAFPRPYLTPEEPTENLLERAGAMSLTFNFSKRGLWFYSPEDLLAWDPEAIFYTDYSHALALKSDPRLTALRAIKNDALYKIPTVGHMWSGHTVEAPLVALWMVHRLYPQLYSRQELIAEMISFYGDFFDYAMSPALAGEIIDGGW